MKRSRFFALPSIALVLGLIHGTPVHAEEPALALIARVHGGTGREEVNAAWLEERVHHVLGFVVGVRILEPSALGTETENQLLGCQGEASCVAQHMSRTDQVLFVALSFEVTPPLLTFQLVKRNEPGEALLELVEVNAQNSGELEDLVQKTLLEVLKRAGHLIGGQLLVETVPPDALVTAHSNDQPLTGSNGTFVVAPGQVEIEATRDGYLPAARSLSIEPEEAVTVSIVLEEDSSFVESPWFWGGVGVLAVSGAVVAVLLVTRGPTPLALCQGDPASGPCQ